MGYFFVSDRKKKLIANIILMILSYWQRKSGLLLNIKIYAIYETYLRTRNEVVTKYSHIDVEIFNFCYYM